jgi:hypothetical protein
VGKPGGARVYTNQRLSPSIPWEGPWKIGQGFKPDSGNLTVRDYRGASGNVRHGGNVNPFRNRKSGTETPHLQRGAPDFYPSGVGHRRWVGSTGNGMNSMSNGRRQPSRGGTSRMSRKAHVRICERLRVKFPGPTRQFRAPTASSWTCPGVSALPQKADQVRARARTMVASMHRRL